MPTERTDLTPDNAARAFTERLRRFELPESAARGRKNTPAPVEMRRLGSSPTGS
jgi:hypothetical protein